MRRTHILGMLLAACLAMHGTASPQPTVVAVVGGTIIDGNGGPPLANGVVIIQGTRISAVGPRGSVSIPTGATVIDAMGRYVVPGFIDTNVHLSLYGGIRDRYETLVRYHSRQNEIVLEAAQLQLKHGITTVRDSYGMLLPLTGVRDAIARGSAPGARILAAGNIVGWGGPYSVSFSLIPEKDLTLFQEQVNDDITQGAGETLMDLPPEELRTAINAYLDKGPDFLKYGGTSHFSQPTFIGFSPEAQRILVEETHKRGRTAETHATTIDGLRLSILAGIDLIQHPEILTPRALPDDLIGLIRDRRVICSMLSNTMTGEAWRKHVKTKEETLKKLQDAEKERKGPARPKTSAEDRKRIADLDEALEVRRQNAQRLIQAGCVVTVGTDNYWGSAPELAREPKPEAQDHGIGTIAGIEGLVELGMSPSQALVAATKNGALACRKLEEFGTLEAGKLADLLVLDADPLTDIHNIRKLRVVMKEGRVVDADRLPEKRVLSRLLVPPPGAPSVVRVVIETTLGEIEADVDGVHAPITVANFLRYVDAGHYNGGQFHRTVKPDNQPDNKVRIEVIQASANKEKDAIAFPPIPLERTHVTGLQHKDGTLSMARSGPDTATSSFSICIGDQPALDFGGQRNADGQGFAAFGNVVTGMDVVRKIQAAPAEGQALRPPVKILAVRRKSIEVPEMRDDDDDEPIEDTEGLTLDSEAEAACPYCGEPVLLVLDPGGGPTQDYVEDCEVCRRPWHVHVHYNESGTAEVWLEQAQ